MAWATSIPRPLPQMSPPALSLEEQLGLRGVINEVKDTLTLGELVQIHRGNPVIGVHTHGGGVDDDLGVGVAVQILIVVLALREMVMISRAPSSEALPAP